MIDPEIATHIDSIMSLFDTSDADTAAKVRYLIENTVTMAVSLREQEIYQQIKERTQEPTHVQDRY